MYATNNHNYTPENFHAGEYPIATDTVTVASGGNIKKFAPVKLDAEGKALVVTATEGVPDTENLYGIAANDAKADEALAVYLTGEFFANALYLEDGVEISALKAEFRKLCIFLK